MTLVAPSGPPATPSVNWRPTPLASLELAEIPTELHFVRDHFPPPERDAGSWSLQLHGDGALNLDREALRALPRRTLRVVLECAGHRRAEFESVPPGLPWATGAVTEARWTGASLGDVLALVGIPIDAREVVLEGADAGPIEGWEGIHRFARSLPLQKALDPDVLVAYEINGEPIAVERGGPVRVIVPGWYATDSVKWLDRLWFTSQEFGGVFQAHDYRFRTPGESGPGQRMDELPVHALITSPAEGESGVATGVVDVRGIAWGGGGGIAEVLIRLDDGPWFAAELGSFRGAYARLSWEGRCLVGPGVREIACRAIDRAGRTQPDRPPENVLGYANNAVHRIRFTAQ